MNSSSPSRFSFVRWMNGVWITPVTIELVFEVVVAARCCAAPAIRSRNAEPGERELLWERRASREQLRRRRGPRSRCGQDRPGSPAGASSFPSGTVPDMALRRGGCGQGRPSLYERRREPSSTQPSSAKARRALCRSLERALAQVAPTSPLLHRRWPAHRDLPIAMGEGEQRLRDELRGVLEGVGGGGARLASRRRDFDRAQRRAGGRLEQIAQGDQLIQALTAADPGRAMQSASGPRTRSSGPRSPGLRADLGRSAERPRWC